MRLLEQYSPDPAFADVAPVAAASDLFCGYLMLDAVIGNTDRHQLGFAGRPSRRGIGPHL